jgi:predicted NAD-dependent protein-ADP-ribosyltransferase YbiA (DUF1768 family)
MSLDAIAGELNALKEAIEDGDGFLMEDRALELLDMVRIIRPGLLDDEDASSKEDVKADEVEIGDLVQGGYTVYTEFPFKFHGVKYKAGMNAFQGSKAANHENGNFLSAGYTSKDTLDLRNDYAMMTVGEANEAGRKVFIKDIRMWDANKDSIMKDIVVTALKLDDPTHCKVDFTLMPTEDTRIIHVGPGPPFHYGVDKHTRTHDGYSKGDNLIGLIVTEYYNKWKNKKTSGSSSGSSSGSFSHFSASPPKKGKGKKAKL